MFTLAEEASTNTFGTFVDSGAMATTLIVLSVIIAAGIIAVALNNLAKAIRELPTILKPAAAPDIDKIVEAVLARVDQHVEAAAANEAGGVRDEMLGHVGQLYNNDAALRRGIEQVADQTNAEVTVTITGNSFWATEGRPAPSGAEWAHPEDIEAARRAALSDDKPRAGSRRAIGSAPEATSVMRTSQLPFDPIQPDSIMNYMMRQAHIVYGALPWEKLTEPIDGIRAGAQLYDLLAMHAEREYGVILPKTFNDVWDALTADERKKYNQPATR